MVVGVGFCARAAVVRNDSESRIGTAVRTCGLSAFVARLPTRFPPICRSRIGYRPRAGAAAAGVSGLMSPHAAVSHLPCRIRVVLLAAPFPVLVVVTFVRELSQPVNTLSP